MHATIIEGGAMGGIDLSSTTGRAEVEKRPPMSRDSGGAVALCSVGNLAEDVVRIWFGRTIIPF
jgi:hypothetical protein